MAAEPGHLEDPVSQSHSFATQYLNDTVNQAQQQRTLAIIRTSPTTGFYFDLFRSRSLGANNFHDYVYHNIGDETIISDTSGVLGLTPTDRYDNDIGDPVGSPGWRYFENEQVTPETAEQVNVQFRVKFDNRSMNLFVPDGVAREYTHAIGPATREAKNGYVNKMTQILAIRQQGEAWERPFIAVIEPSTNFDTSVQSVTQLMQGEQVVGAKVVSLVDGQTVTNYIICQESADSLFEDKALGLSFTGRFGVVTDRGGDDVELYIGEGAFLTYGTHVLSSSTGQATAAWCRFSQDQELAVNAHSQVNVGRGDIANLFLDINGSNAILSWPGTDMKLQQSQYLTRFSWVSVPGGDVRPVVVPLEADKPVFFRILEN